MHKPESILENETLKILGDFEIQTNHLIPTERPVITKEKKKKKEKKRTCRMMDFAIPTDHRVKIKEKKKKKKKKKKKRKKKKKKKENLQNNGLCHSD